MNSLQEFYDKCNVALQSKKEYEMIMSELCDYLTKISPHSNQWYYNNNGYLLIDIKREEYESYFKFVEDIVNCSYCHLMRDNGLTLMLSIATIIEKMD